MLERRPDHLKLKDLLSLGHGTASSPAAEDLIVPLCRLAQAGFRTPSGLHGRGEREGFTA